MCIRDSLSGDRASRGVWCLDARWHAVEAQAKRHPACLQGALGFLGVHGSAVETAMVSRQKINGRPGVS
eukprot:9286818-Pyramimonas_sp.AAC.1